MTRQAAMKEAQRRADTLRHVYVVLEKVGNPEECIVRRADPEDWPDVWAATGYAFPDGEEEAL